MKREVKVRGRDVVLYLLRQKKKKLVREERDSGGHTVYIFELDDDDLKAVHEITFERPLCKRPFLVYGVIGCE